jgi:hypothetical protein
MNCYAAFKKKNITSYPTFYLILIIIVIITPTLILGQTSATPGVCYASTGNIDGGRLLTIDLTTGAGMLIGPTGLSAVPALAINSSGEIYGIETDTNTFIFDLYRIDAASGTADFIANTDLFWLSAITFNENDTLYGLAIDINTFIWGLYTINTDTGIPTLIGLTELDYFTTKFAGMAFDPTTGTLWASTSWEGEIYTIDMNTGTPTLIGTTGLDVGTPDILFDDEGNLYAVTGGGRETTNNLVSIDKMSGAGTVIGPIGFTSVSGAAFAPQRLEGPHIGLPANINFGKVEIGINSEPQTITIRSIGSENLTVSAISDPAVPFSLSNVPALPLEIPPGGSETFDVGFSPGSAGAFNATITITSNDVDNPIQDISLSGEGSTITSALPGVCYASTGNIDGGRLLTINLDTGAGTLIGSTGLDAVSALAINSSGEIYGIKTDTTTRIHDLYRIDASSGTAEFVASPGLYWIPAIAFDENEVLHALALDRSSWTWNLYTISTATGVPTLIGPTNLSVTLILSGMAFDPTTGTLWASTNGEEIYNIDINTGTATIIGTTGLGVRTPDILLDDEGNLYAVTGGGRETINNLASIDKTTGKGTVIGPIGFTSVSGAAFAHQELEGPQIGLPTGINFGKVEPGTISEDRTISIRNIGSENLTVSTISNPAAPFSISDVPTLPQVIPPGGSETFDVSFSPNSAGTFNSTITITSNDADNPTREITLSGEGFTITSASPGICYASTGNIDGGRLLTIDLDTGAGTLIGETGLNEVPALAINSTGRIFGIDDRTLGLYCIDAASGTAVYIANTGLYWLPAIAFNDQNVLYGLGYDRSTFTWNLFTINVSTATPTLIGPTDAGISWRGMAFDPTTGDLWASTNEEDIYIIDIYTGYSMLIGATGLGVGTPDIFFDNDGNLYAVTGGGEEITNNLVSINKVSGVGTVIGPIGFTSVSGAAFGHHTVQGPLIGLPTNINFGKVEAGTNSEPQTITIRSIGSENLTVSTISNPPAPFSISNVPTLPLIIPPGGSETFDVGFSPGSAVTFNTTITITSNDADDPIQEISLSGEGFTVTAASPGVCYASTGNSDGGRLLTINLDTGAGTLIGPTGLNAVPALAINSSGAIYGIDGDYFDLYSIDAASGTAIFIANTGLDLLPAIAFDKNDVLYGLGKDPNTSLWNLYTISLGTGTPTIIGPTEQGINWRGMSFDPITGALWASTAGEEIYVIDIRTGEVRFIGITGLGVDAPDIFFDSDRNLFSVTGGGKETINNLAAIDRISGVGTIIGPIGFSSVSGIAIRHITTADINNLTVNIPSSHELSQNYPNPFNPTTKIRFALPQSSKVILEVFNIQGQRVATLINGKQTPGYHEVVFYGHGLNSGLYFYRIQSEKFSDVKRMVLVK